MKEVLQKLEQILKNLEAPVLSYLNPPMNNEDELISFVREHWKDVMIPQELIELYRWHNGTKHQDDMDVRPTFIAHELGLCNFKVIEENIYADEIYHYRSDGLIPIFSSYFGEDLALDLKVEKGKLVYCSTSDYEIPSMITKYDSLECLIQTIIEQFNSQCLILNDEGYVTVDYDRYGEYMRLGEKLNPLSDYWRVKREFQEGA